MSSCAVASAEATSTFTPVPVTRRALIHEGPVIDIRVAKDADAGEYWTLVDEQRLPFLRFSRGIPGHHMKLFVHTESDVRNRTIRARVKLLSKELADGREYYYIDLIPVGKDVPATHRLGFLPAGTVSRDMHPAWLIFDTPYPVQAQVVFAEPDAKFPQQAPKHAGPDAVVYSTQSIQHVRLCEAPAGIQKPPRELPHKGVQVAGDGQLKRLFDQGWEVLEEDGKTVTLTRTNGKGEQKTMIHHRPKKH
jgi:hypothetical protein